MNPARIIITGFLSQSLFKAVLAVFLGLVLYGIVDGRVLVVALVLFTLVQLIRIASELISGLAGPALPEETAPPLTSGHLPPLMAPTRLGETSAPANERSGSGDGLEELAVAGSGEMLPPRSAIELGAEALGVMAFALLVPLCIGLYARDFFSFRSPQGWQGAAVVLLCVGAYAYPFYGFRAPEHSSFRICWWALPFAVVLPFLYHGISVLHPYLDPTNPDRNRLAAERVLATPASVHAGRHADWILRYARELDAIGEWEQAIQFYREALRAAPGDQEIGPRLSALERQLWGGKRRTVPQPEVPASAPYWQAGQAVPQAPRQKISQELESVEVCTVVLVPVGPVRHQVLDHVAYAVEQELGLPVCVSSETVPLPPATRVRGMVTGPQWAESRLVQAFTNTVRAFPSAPIKYMLITPADIYSEDFNYLFSANYDWGAVVSFARFGRGGDDPQVWHRTAKQTVCALAKSFLVPASPDFRCVTSYSRSLEEFDRKGNRLVPATREMFQQAVELLNWQWQNRAAAVPGS